MYSTRIDMLCWYTAVAARHDNDTVQVSRRVWIVLDEDVLGHSAALPRCR